MLLTLLRLADAADAGDCFEAATRDPARFLRWAAMREWLALDVAAASARLSVGPADVAIAEERAAV